MRETVDTACLPPQANTQSTAYFFDEEEKSANAKREMLAWMHAKDFDEKFPKATIIIRWVNNRVHLRLSRENRVGRLKCALSWVLIPVAVIMMSFSWHYFSR